MLPQRGDGLRVEIYKTPASRGLRRTEHNGIADCRDRLYDGELRSVEGHVGPAETENLAPAYTRCCE